MKTSQKIKKNKTTILLIQAVLLVGILIGRWTSGGQTSSADHVHHAQENTVWTCSMHPQIRQENPGSCPLCGMGLIPADEAEDDTGLPPDALRMSPTAMQLAQVHTQKVTLGEAAKDIRLFGKVTMDPSRSFSQNAHFSGRIEAFYFNSLGEYITEGSKIAELYSPEIFTAQKELISAYKNRENAPGIFEAVKEKMRLWKISENQIQEIISSEKATEYFPIYANQSGYLVQKNVEKGEYVTSGQSLFTLSKLTSLWGIFDVYEKDAVFVKKGMSVEYSLPSMPGKKFETILDFVEPVLNPETRTLTARIKIDNPNLDFKPEMLINGKLHASLPTEKNKIVIPKSAVMWTGKHSVVYVKYASENHVGFQMRSVVLGPALEEGYVVEEGLDPGEEIVVEGTFSVDAAAQLANKPSMMNFTPAASDRIVFPKTTLSDKEKSVLIPFYQRYFKLKDALVSDDFEKAKSIYIQLVKAWKSENWNALSKDLEELFKNLGNEDFLNEKQISQSSSIDVLRNTSFLELSNTLIRVLNQYEPFENTVYIQHCPMADSDRGADWLSLEKEIRNPYYGASMLTCGEVSKTVEKK